MLRALRKFSVHVDLLEVIQKVVREERVREMTVQEEDIVKELMLRNTMRTETSL
jgi:hypothetical protein